MRKTCLVVATFMLSVVELGCGSTDETMVAQQRQLWEESRPDRYVVQSCTFNYEPDGCVRVAVSGDMLVEAEEHIYAAGLDWESFEPTSKPIDYMFDAVESGADDDCDAVDVTYDATYGFVESYRCDSTTYGREILCFEPDTLDLASCDAVPRTTQ